jgi:hypothetical protein
VLLVLALALEPMLVDRRRPMRRPHGRKTLARPPRFVVLARPCAFSMVDDAVPDRLALLARRHAGGRDPAKAARGTDSPALVPLAGLHRRLDLVAAIAADPLRRARRLALHLARSRPGRILAPDPTLRPRGAWNTQAALSFSALAHDIEERSRSRPPPLQAPRRHWPSVTVLS